MFSLNSVFICTNLRYAPNKMEFIFYSVSEIPVLIFGFITISFTSYNLDMYDKQVIGLVGTCIATMFYIFFLSLRISEIVKFYKTLRLKKEQDPKKNTTNINMMRDNYQSDLGDSVHIDNIRHPPKQREIDEMEDTMKIEKPKPTPRDFVDEEEYKF
mmetsp:Transcript_16014/g.13993  ORF Transcript_16014/g.13993 Transcript_16014/m.13993 type:complete len:157 (+) Transcript_16014:939-1409(+)